MTLPYPTIQRGRRFGFLTVVSRAKVNGLRTWLCECDCGRLTYATTNKLNADIKKSCGCMRFEMIDAAKRKHGRSGTPEHQVWKGMTKRCTNRNSKDYEEYGARGIAVCDEWRKSFRAFFDHIGPRPTPQHSLDRIDNARGYEPGNVRWATPKEQSNNRRARRWSKKP